MCSLCHITASDCAAQSDSPVCTVDLIPSYPVNDFRFEGADDAGVVENRVLSVQVSEGHRCLCGQNKDNMRQLYVRSQ